MCAPKSLIIVKYIVKSVFRHLNVWEGLEYLDEMNLSKWKYFFDQNLNLLEEKVLRALCM